MRHAPPPLLVAASLVLAATSCGRTTAPSDGSTPTGVVGQGDGTDGGVSTDDGTDRAPPSDSASGSPTPTADAGRTLTVEDDGDELVLRVGEQVELVQSDPLSADPTVDGDAVELVEVVSVVGTGRREWEVRAVAPGRSVLSVPDGATSFRVTITVG